MKDVAISVQNVSKLYKLYDKPSDRLKESLGLSKKKRYKEHYALSDVSFDVKRGECVGIIGTNGAGKSTILKIITGVLNQTEGKVDIDGRISALLELGAGFNQEYTGIENVYLNGTMIGFTKEEIDKKLDAILEFADIGDFVYQPVKTYSSGMFVRLAFAVAINIEPEILIVDEALSVGDVFFQSKCFHKFEEFKAMGKTILFVSHDLSSINKYCDRAILLNKGKKVAEGTPKDMTSLYKRILVNQYDPEKDNVEDYLRTRVAENENENLLDNESSNEEHLNTNTVKQKQDSSVEEKTNTSVDKPVGKFTTDNVAPGSWKANYNLNPNVDEYGDGSATIIDFAIIDDIGTVTNAVAKDTDFVIKSKVMFHKRIDNPIFTYTFKDAKGTAITGTNSMYEKAHVGVVNEGDVYVATFKQHMNLQGGEYLLSISCTGFEGDDFKVYHRLYDVLNVIVVSEKDTVGFYDMFSKVNVEKV